MLDLGPVRSDSDFMEILELQRANLAASLSPEEIASQGFVTVVHSAEILRAMHALSPSIVAREGGRVVAYALVMPVETKALLPILAPMFARLETMTALAGVRFYVMGQICVAKSQRGRGIVDALYHSHRQHLGGRFDAVVTEIATRNTRSMRAHARVGFETLETYRDATDEWAIVSWRWR